MPLGVNTVLLGMLVTTASHVLFCLLNMSANTKITYSSFYLSHMARRS